MDINVTLTPEESAAIAAMADEQRLTLAEVLRVPLSPWLAQAVAMYRDELPTPSATRFAIGDRVELQSGGPEMTISFFGADDGGGIRCSRTVGSVSQR